MSAFIQDWKTSITNVYINIDFPEHESLVEQWNITKLPQFVLIDDIDDNTETEIARLVSSNVKQIHAWLYEYWF